MSHLILIALGPVQEFIAAARRTGDLAAGSRLLVKLAQEVGRTVQAAGGDLIFPSHPGVVGPNKILANLPLGDPADAAARAARAAREFLDEAWQGVWTQKANHLTRYLDSALADAQIEGLLEFYAAWWPLEGNYSEARQKVERLLAGRKALRTFDPPPERPGRPKSPLDPSRDCVLRTDSSRYTVPEECRSGPLWLKPRETLDAVSLLKRLRAERGVPSTSLMAVRAVLPEMRAKVPEVIDKLKEIADRTEGALDLGDLFFLQEGVVEEGMFPDVDTVHVLDLCRKALRSVGLDEAPAYYAIFVADGDHMGKLIAAQPDEESHRRLSLALSEFAREADETIHSLDGYPVYSGGDDALALVPATVTIECARKLRDEFVSRLAGFRSGQAMPGISAGIAIVHHLTPLQTALEHARAAERLAKKERDSLAVALHVRGGPPLKVSLPWDSVDTWGEWIEAFRSGLARGVPYELSRLAREWCRTDWPDPKHASQRLMGEVRRVFERKEGGSGRTPPGWVKDAGSLGQFANLLTIARFLTRFEARTVSEKNHG